MNWESFGLWVLTAAVAATASFVAYALATKGKEDSFAISLVRALTWMYARLVHRLKIVGANGDCLPAEGACILVSNHRSGVDPVILSVVTHRRVRFLMAREYYDVPVLRWLFRALRCIPVNRDGADFGGTKEALRALRAGEVIGIFPQGGIREEGTPLEGKSGVALLAVRSKALVVPFRIDGSPNLDSVFGALFTPSRTVVRVGSPLSFAESRQGKSSRSELDRVTGTILNAIESLAPQETSPTAGEAKELRNDSLKT
jgi:1-acyl-sn-glycerol-3-phosphate acyltransferase